MVYTVSHKWGRKLPHIETQSHTYYVTIVTKNRRFLPPTFRDAVLATILSGHLQSFALYCAVVMPDHAHFIATPYDETRLPEMIQFIKSVSARRVKQRHLWQPGYFDRIVREEEDLRARAEYVVANPVRAGLVERVEDYPWIWRSWIEGRG